MKLLLRRNPRHTNHLLQRWQELTLELLKDPYDEPITILEDYEEIWELCRPKLTNEQIGQLIITSRSNQQMEDLWPTTENKERPDLGTKGPI